MFSGREILDLAIKIEKNGARVYRDALQNISDPSLASTLQWLADEELLHAQRFSELREVTIPPTDDPQLEEIGGRMLRRVVGDQVFSLDDVNFSKITTVTNLLEHAIEFEKDTVLFYNMIRSLIQDQDTLDQVERIIHEENRHIEALEELLKKNPSTIRDCSPEG